MIYKCTKKRIQACLLVLLLSFSAVLAYAFSENSVVVTADDGIQSTGYISYDKTYVRIRTSTDTSNTDNVITMVDGGFQLDIYGTEYPTANYPWYSVGFYLDGTYRRGYVAAEFVTINSSGDSGYTEDVDFEEYLNTQGFPESYKDGLRQIHAQYPKWVFVADHTGVDWNTLVESQNVNGQSLIYSSAPSSWKSTAAGCYDWSTGEYVLFDSGGWVQASSELVQYSLDPRNYFSLPSIFAFESLAYNSGLQSESGVNSIIAGSFMDGSSHYLEYNGLTYNYSSGLMLAGSMSGVSPYHLATRIIQEQGWSGNSYSISGNLSGYEGYYNYYNQGAAMGGGNSAVVNGLIYASRYDEFTLRPWNTRMKSLIGGAKFIGNGYINVGQSTLYYEKFDIRNFWHQYMTNILAPRSEASTASEAYSTDMRVNTALVFTIPIYQNMPDSACAQPVGDGSPNNRLNSLGVDGYNVTPTFSMYTNDYDLIVDNSVTSVNISGERADSTASVSGLGTYQLSVGTNTFRVAVTAQNGEVNTYTITIVRKEQETAGTGEGFTTIYTLDNDRKTVSNIAIGTSVADFISGFTLEGGATAKLLRGDGSEASGNIATGNVMTIYGSSGDVLGSYTIVLYGDATGDGDTNIFDIVRIKRYILGYVSMDSASLEAADCNHDGNVNIFDIVAIKNTVLGKRVISQG